MDNQSQPLATDLSFATDEELWDALKVRFDGLILIGKRNHPTAEQPFGWMDRMRMHGDSATIRGLITFAGLQLDYMHIQSPACDHHGRPLE